MTTSPAARRLRILFVLAVVAGATRALKAAVADTGGSYDPADVRR